MVQHEVLAAFVQTANVGGHDPPVGEHLEPVGVQPHRHSPPGQASRHRVKALTHTHPGLGVNLAGELSKALERLRRQRAQRRRLNRERFADRHRAPADAPVVVGPVRRGEQLVQLAQRPDTGHRDQVAATEPPDLAFHPTLLMSPFLARQAEETVVTVM